MTITPTTALGRITVSTVEASRAMRKLRKTIREAAQAFERIALQSAHDHAAHSPRERAEAKASLLSSFSTIRNRQARRQNRRR